MFGLSTLTATSVAVYSKPRVVVVRSTVPTAAPTDADAAAAATAEAAVAKPQFLFTLPQRGYIWCDICTMSYPPSRPPGHLDTSISSTVLRPCPQNTLACCVCDHD